AEDGIRDFHVTGVQTCALPISTPGEGADNGAAWAWAFGVGAGGAFAYGPTPDGLPGVALWVGFEAISDEATVSLRPAVRLTGARSEERRVGREWRVRQLASAEK